MQMEWCDAIRKGYECVFVCVCVCVFSRRRRSGLKAILKCSQVIIYRLFELSDEKKGKKKRKRIIMVASLHLSPTLCVLVVPLKLWPIQYVRMAKKRSSKKDVVHSFVNVFHHHFYGVFISFECSIGFHLISVQLLWFLCNSFFSFHTSIRGGSRDEVHHHIYFLHHH